MKVTESRSGTRYLHPDNRGERCFVATERAAEGHLAGGGTETRPHADRNPVLQEAMQAVGDFCAGRRLRPAAGVPVGTELVLPIPAAGPAGAEESRQSPASDRGTYSRSAVLPLRTVKLFGGSVYIFLCGRLQVKDFFLAQTAADDSRRAYDQRTGRHDGVLGDQRACCD